MSGRRDTGETSRFLEDLLGADAVDTVDGACAGEVAVVIDDVGTGAAALPPRIVDSLPDDVETIIDEGAGALLYRAGDDPLDDVPVVGLIDDDGARVLDTDSIDAVDGVGAGDAGPVDDLGAGNRARSSGEDHEGGDDESVHAADGTDRFRLPRWAKVPISVFVVVFVAMLAFAIFQPIKVLPRERVAPGFSFVDQAGEAFTSESARGTVTLYTFAPLDCGTECADIHTTMVQVRERVGSEVELGDMEFSMVTIGLADDPTPEALADAASQSGADGVEWRWVGGEWDRVRTVVGAGFKRYFDREESGHIAFDRGFVLVDGNGVIRGEYRYQTLSSDADKLVRHVGLLADEIRLSHGPAALAYEAAHLFACYG